ncbi:MAG: TOBE domain-containing protein [Pseudomonadota bacterium]
MGETNRIPVRAKDGALRTPLGTLPLAGQSPARAPLAGAWVACIRPEALGQGGSVDLGPSRVVDAAFFGTYTRVHVTPDADPSRTLVAHLPPTQVPEPGALLALSADPDAFSLFPDPVTHSEETAP